MRYMRKLHPDLDILVSNIGEVFLPATKGHQARWTFGSKNNEGYRAVKINGKVYKVHRLVVETFIGPIPDGYEVDHINRDRSDNRVGIDGNLRIVTKSENQRNTAQHDRVTERGGTHRYEDARQYQREKCARYYQTKRKTNRKVNFSDGSYRWIPLAEADAYLIIPLKERHYAK